MSECACVHACMHACACVFDELSVSDGPLLVAMQGKTFGLTFWENYYIVGQGPDFQFVRYIGHTLQGGYNGLCTCTPACAKHACERGQKRAPMPVSAVPARRLHSAYCSLLPRLLVLSLPFGLYHVLSLHTLPPAPAPAPLLCACADEAGAFVLSKTPELSPAALQEVKKIAKEQGLDLGGFCRINNKACGVSNTKSPANDLQDVIGVCACCFQVCKCRLRADCVGLTSVHATPAVSLRVAPSLCFFRTRRRRQQLHQIHV